MALSSLQRFAEAVDRALAVPTGIESFGDDKFFVASLYDEEFAEEMSLEEFKGALLEAHRAGLVVLSRADLIPAMDQDLADRSEIIDPYGATYNFVRREDTHAAVRRLQENPMATRKKTRAHAKRKSSPRKAHRDPVDEHAATELVMFIENTSDLSPDGPSGQGRSVLLNALRKWRKGTYNPELAVRLFEYLAEAGAKRYQKEFGSDAPIFNPATRHEAARQLEESFRSSAEGGEYDRVDTRVGVHEAGAAREAAAPRDDIIEFSAKGHTWRWQMLSSGQGSLLCLDPAFDDDGVDQSTWPSNEEVSRHVGRKVRFFDAGDSPSYPEGIYNIVDTRVGVHSSEARRQPNRWQPASYPYGSSRSGQYILSRDGSEIMRGSEQEIWRWMHSNLGYSIDHALKYEGYNIAPTGNEEVEEAPRAGAREGGSIGRAVEFRWEGESNWQRTYGTTEREAADHIAALVASHSPVPGKFRRGNKPAIAISPHLWRMPTGAVIETRLAGA